MMQTMKFAFVILSVSAAFSNATHLRRVRDPAVADAADAEMTNQSQSDIVVQRSCPGHDQRCNQIFHLIKQRLMIESFTESESVKIDQAVNNSFFGLQKELGNDVDAIYQHLLQYSVAMLKEKAQSEFPYITDQQLNDAVSWPNAPLDLSAAWTTIIHDIERAHVTNGFKSHVCKKMRNRNTFTRQFEIFPTNNSLDSSVKVSVQIVKCAIIERNSPGVQTENAALLEEVYTRITQFLMEAQNEKNKLTGNCNTADKALTNGNDTRDCFSTDKKRKEYLEAATHFWTNTKKVQNLLPRLLQANTMNAKKFVNIYDAQFYDHLGELRQWKDMKSFYGATISNYSLCRLGDDCYVLSVANRFWQSNSHSDYNGYVHGLWPQQHKSPVQGSTITIDQASAVNLNSWAGKSGYVGKMGSGRMGDERAALLVDEWFKHGAHTGLTLGQYAARTDDLWHKVHALNIPDTWTKQKSKWTNYCFTQAHGTWRPARCA
jgi:hypothetical protein